MTVEDRQSVLDELFFEGREWAPFLRRFAVLTILSTLIAAFGLVADSVAVIIGAMLVAPLMTPILAVAAALVLSNVRQLVTNLAVLAGGVVLAIGTAWLATRLGLQDLTTATALPDEILGRTSPSLLDLGVAVAAGLAAGYVITHPRVSSSIAGVAIAVALVPPLATVGITYSVGATAESRGALLLFATNLVAIVLAAIVVMLLSGLVPEGISTTRTTGLGFVVSAVLLVAIAVPLTIHTRDAIVDRSFQGTLQEAVALWDPNAEILTSEADIVSDDLATVEMEIATTSVERPPVWELAEALSAETGRVVEIEVRLNLQEQDVATSG